MEAYSLKSKKILHSFSSKPENSDQMVKSTTDPTPWSSKTPDKPANPPRRSRRALMSLKEVRDEARRIQKTDRDRCEQPSSADQQIGSGAGKSPARKAKRKVDGTIKLPERFEILCKFFESLDSSIRLLRIRGSVSTFTNISPKVQHFTDRRFTYGHLAQLKHIVPEVFELKKILVHDDRTSSMKPELLVDLKLDALENDGKSSDRNSHVRKVFRARLLEYSKAHPEGEVPEDELPEPFNCSKQALLPSMANANSSSLREASTGLLSGMQPLAASHLPPSYRNHFSLSNRQVTKPLTLDITEEAAEESSTQKCDNSKPTPMESGSISDSFKATPLKLDKSKSFKETPMKSLMTTPAQLPQKRHYMTPDDKSVASPNKLVTRRPCNRPLKFDTPVKKNTKAKGEDYCTGGLSIDDDIFDILPASLCQSISEKEKKILEAQDPAISQAKKRHKMIANLPKLCDMIIFFFQSVNRSVATKEELMHRIIGSCLDIVDRGEVEEQLCLLEELVPEWIQEKSAATGDLLICVNKMMSSELIRSKIVEAK